MSDETVSVRFGPFELDPAVRLLRRDGVEVQLGSRSMDLLLVLVERAGTLLTHRELVSSVWPDTIVENSALRVYVSALRRALGDGEDGARYVLNEHGRGYRFVAPIQRTATPPYRSSNLPAPIGRIIGRSDLLKAIAAAYGRNRLVTLLGPGGIGKSTTAIAAAMQMADDTNCRAYFVDLALVEDAGAVAHAIAGSLCTSVVAGREVRTIAQSLPPEPVLLVLDNCEHVAEAAAAMVDALLAALPQMSILATSREPLRLKVEHLIRLSGMDVPPDNPGLTAAEVGTYPAVQLFLERTASTAAELSLNATNAPVIATLCRKLEGIPLALELAAGWAGLMSIETILANIDEQMLTLSGGRRTALPRHRTLHAVLDWSYQSLTENDQAILAELGAFRGAFHIDAAEAVLSPRHATTLAVALSRLAEKSLLWSGSDDDGTLRYRLLETTRSYARSKLVARGDANEVYSRHARYCVESLRGADEQLLRMNRSDWMRRYGSTLSDVRAALAWAFSPEGNVSIGVALTCVSTQVALQSLVPSEFRRYFAIALAHIQAASSTDLRQAIKVNFAVAMLTTSQGEWGLQHFQKAARLLAGSESRLIPEEIAAGFASNFTQGDYPASGRYADQMIAMGENEEIPEFIYAGSRMRAQVLHYMGQHAAARHLASWVLEGPLQFLPLTNISHHISMRIILARVAYLEGDAQLAHALADDVVERARDSNPPALCQALTAAFIPVQAAAGNFEAVRTGVALLKQTAFQHDMDYWIGWSNGLEIAIDLLGPAGDRHAANVQFSLSLKPLTGKLVDLLATLDVRLVTPLAQNRVDSRLVGWSAPEVLRAQALKAADPTLRHAGLQAALKLAQDQGAVLFADRVEAALSRPIDEPVPPSLRMDAQTAKGARNDPALIFDS